MNVKYPRAKPYFYDQDIDEILIEIKAVLKSGYLIQGEKVRKFEDLFLEKVGTKYAVATNSCTSALEITLKSLDLKDRKVLVPTQTFIASGNSVLLSGNIPVFTDIDKLTQCMSYETMMARMSEEVSAIIIVHMGGLISPDIERIKYYCEENDIFLIEDAAHAHGSMYLSKFAGSIGDAGCFSFYPTKLITTGEGGIITTDNQTLADKAIKLRNHGSDGTFGLFPASNDRMTEISAIIGISQLKHLDKFIEKRNYISNQYKELLSEIPEIEFFPNFETIKNSYWNFYFILSDNIDRKKFMYKMMEYGIQTGDAYTPQCHNQPVFKEYVINHTFKNADYILKKHVSLPMYAELDEKDLIYITSSVKNVINEMISEKNL